MPFTNYTSRVLTSYMFGRHEFIPPDIFYVALSTVQPTIMIGEDLNWDFREPNLNGYERVAITNIPDNWTECAEQPDEGYSHQNNLVITFPKAIGPWGCLVAFGIFDAPQGGHLLGFGNLEIEQTITNGDVASFPVGSLTITLL